MSLSTSHDASSKSDQIAHKFFSKFALLLHNARATPHLPQAKVDKWFNLETPDTDHYRDHLRLYRTLSTSAQSLPPFELQVLLSVPELATNQVLVLSDASATRARVEPTPSHVLLESWVVVFSPGRPCHDDDRQDVALSSVYKQSISVFRSMFTLLRVLPAWKLFRRLRRTEGSNLAIQVRVADHNNEDRMLKFGTPLSTSVSSLPTSSHAFPPVAHPLGTLTISTTYLLSPLFQIDTLESLLSSRFLSQDDESFTPTLTARHQASLSGSPIMRASLPRSPPGPSFADRFVLPANTTAHSSSPLRAPPASLSRATSGSGSRHSGSGGSASRPVSLLGTLPPGSDSPAGSSSPKSGLHALPEATATAPPPSPVPLPARRPSINTIHPFKSATLSSGGSPSLHSHSGVSSSLRHSPLSGSAGGPSLPSRPPLSSSPSPRAPPTYPPPSPMSIRQPSTQRPSPPSDRPPQGKRYSSSFGHRYTTSGGAGSDGSPGKRADEKDRPASASFLSTTTDDDEISAFVQAIDARAPLSMKRGLLRETSGDTGRGGGKLGEGEGEDSARVQGKSGEGRLELENDEGRLRLKSREGRFEHISRTGTWEQEREQAREQEQGVLGAENGGEKDEAPRIGCEGVVAGRLRVIVGETAVSGGPVGISAGGNEGRVGWDRHVEEGEVEMEMPSQQDERECDPLPRKYRDRVDAELKRMNDAFKLSLVGLEGRGRGRRRGSGGAGGMSGGSVGGVSAGTGVAGRAGGRTGAAIERESESETHTGMRTAVYASSSSGDAARPAISRPPSFGPHSSRQPSFSNSPRSPSNMHVMRPTTLLRSSSSPGSPLTTHGADRGLRLGLGLGLRSDSPTSVTGRGFPSSPSSSPSPSLSPLPSPSRAAEYTRLPDSSAPRGSPLRRPALTLFPSSSQTGSPSASASGNGSPATSAYASASSGSGSGSPAPSGAAQPHHHRHYRTISMASGSDEIIGRLEFDDPGQGRMEGRLGGPGYARGAYPYR